MQHLKSFGDGIGTAAGVAWPTFGLIFGTLGLSIGGTAVLILSSVASGLFLLVAIPITIWSYHQHRTEREALIANCNQLIDHFLLNLFNLFLLQTNLVLMREKNNIRKLDKKELVEYLRKQIKNLSNPSVQSLNLIVEDRLEEFIEFLYEHNYALNESNNDKIIDNYVAASNLNSTYFNNFISISALPFVSKFKTGIGAFTAAFGSIAGCASGTLGVLSAVGIFGSLTAVPIVGWAILAGAIVFGVVVAGICIYSSLQKHKIEQLIHHYKEMNGDLGNMISSTQQEIVAQQNKKLAKQTSIHQNQILKIHTPPIKQSQKINIQRNRKRRYTFNDERMSKSTQILWNNLSPALPKHQAPDSLVLSSSPS